MGITCTSLFKDGHAIAQRATIPPRLMRVGGDSTTKPKVRDHMMTILRDAIGGMTSSWSLTGALAVVLRPDAPGNTATSSHSGTPKFGFDPATASWASHTRSESVFRHTGPDAKHRATCARWRDRESSICVADKLLERNRYPAMNPPRLGSAWRFTALEFAPNIAGAAASKSS